MKVYIASDHSGFELKQVLAAYLRNELHLEVVDCGATTLDPMDDYPDYMKEAAGGLAEDAAAGVDSRAIVLGGSGQGEAMVMDRFPGVRCAVYYGEAGEQNGCIRQDPMITGIRWNDRDNLEVQMVAKPWNS